MCFRVVSRIPVTVHCMSTHLCRAPGPPLLEWLRKLRIRWLWGLRDAKQQVAMAAKALITTRATVDSDNSTCKQRPQFICEWWLSAQPRFRKKTGHDSDFMAEVVLLKKVCNSSWFNWTASEIRAPAAATESSSLQLQGPQVVWVPISGEFLFGLQKKKKGKERKAQSVWDLMCRHGACMVSNNKGHLCSGDITGRANTDQITLNNC